MLLILLLLHLVCESRVMLFTALHWWGGWIGFGGLAGLTVVGGLTASCSYIIPFAYAGRRGPCTIILLVIVY